MIKAVLPDSFIDYRRQRIANRIRARHINTVSISQIGQDYWIYGECFNEESGFFLDIGAHDGVFFSNSFILEERYGWKGICIEANPDTFAKLKQNRKCRCIDVCVDEEEGEVSFASKGMWGGIIAEDCDNPDHSVEEEMVTVRATRLDKILEDEKAPQVIDYLSIDIEGAEDRALLTFPFDKYTFNCITIERPSEALRKVFDKNGYMLVRDVPEMDAFYIHKSFEPRYLRNMYKFSLKKFTIGESYQW